MPGESKSLIQGLVASSIAKTMEGKRARSFVKLFALFLSSLILSLFRLI